MSSSHVYSDTFFNYIEQGSISSAEAVVAVLRRAAAIDSVVDVGCGRGAWLKVWKDQGVADVLGIDGDYVNRATLLVADGEFRAVDLSARFTAGRRFDIATSFEVAEHLPPAASEGLVDSMVGLSDVIAFSAAVVGQGGENHINERPLEFWRRLFEQRGYTCFDVVRPQVRGNQAVMPWYRNNILLYANGEGQRRLSQEALRTRVSAGTALAREGGLAWLARRTLVRVLPRSVVTAIAKANSARLARKYSRDA